MSHSSSSSTIINLTSSVQLFFADFKTTHNLPKLDQAALSHAARALITTSTQTNNTERISPSGLYLTCVRALHELTTSAMRLRFLPMTDCRKDYLHAVMYELAKEADGEFMERVGREWGGVLVEGMQSKREEDDEMQGEIEDLMGRCHLTERYMSSQEAAEKISFAAAAFSTSTNVVQQAFEAPSALKFRGWSIKAPDFVKDSDSVLNSNTSALQTSGLSVLETLNRLKEWEDPAKRAPRTQTTFEAPCREGEMVLGVGERLGGLYLDESCT